MSGADFTQSLTTDEYPHCQAARAAWYDVENTLLCNTSTAGSHRHRPRVPWGFLVCVGVRVFLFVFVFV
jgi:hypothetical protein